MNNSKTASETTFRTLFEFEASERKIVPNSNLLFIGSCFTQNIGDKCTNSGLNTKINPFGIVYNPISIGMLLERLMRQKFYVEEEVLFANGLYHTFDHHSSYSNSNKEVFLANVNQELGQSGEFLNKTDFLFLTFGSAFVYEYKENTQLVANCHKYPSKCFNQRLLQIDEIVDFYTTLLTKLFNLSKTLNIVLSISPIRHLKDGLQRNNTSKSTLILAIAKLQEIFPQITYFPAYEIVLDELRDYRFFSDDLVHLNSTAVNYIWSRFVETFFHDSTSVLAKDYNKILNDLNHRPFNSRGDEYYKFLLNIKQKVDLFEKNHQYCISNNFKEQVNTLFKCLENNG